jgi:hypothetical protein
MSQKPRIVVLHRYYGCDTGCCGHVVELDGEQVGQFEFIHPYGNSASDFIRDLVTDRCGAEHVADIDWENCIVTND